MRKKFRPIKSLWTHTHAHSRIDEEWALLFSDKILRLIIGAVLTKIHHLRVGNRNSFYWLKIDHPNWTSMIFDTWNYCHSFTSIIIAFIRCIGLFQSFIIILELVVNGPIGLILIANHLPTSEPYWSNSNNICWGYFLPMWVGFWSTNRTCLLSPVSSWLPIDFPSFNVLEQTLKQTNTNIIFLWSSSSLSIYILPLYT